ncbi:MAG: hypothetical protein HYZ63_03065 [Candidatus Andersenbacteria bacterium]|nr:hypothetical protein [Candidatus Andersenbacteria bacterium]
MANQAYVYVRIGTIAEGDSVPQLSPTLSRKEFLLWAGSVHDALVEVNGAIMAAQLFVGSDRQTRRIENSLSPAELATLEDVLCDRLGFLNGVKVFPASP